MFFVSLFLFDPLSYPHLYLMILLVPFLYIPCLFALVVFYRSFVFCRFFRFFSHDGVTDDHDNVCMFSS